MSQKFQAIWLTWAAYSFQAPETTNLSPKSAVSIRYSRWPGLGPSGLRLGSYPLIL